MKDLPSPADDVSSRSAFCPERRLSGRGNGRGSNYLTSFQKCLSFKQGENSCLSFEETFLKKLYNFSRLLVNKRRHGNIVFFLNSKTDD